MSRPESSLTTAAQETLDLFNDDSSTTVSFRPSNLSFNSGAPIFGSAAPRNRTVSKVRKNEDLRAKRDSPTLPQAWRRTASQGMTRSSSLSSPPLTASQSHDSISPYTSTTSSNGFGTTGIPHPASAIKTPSKPRLASKPSRQSAPPAPPKELSRPDSPDIETIMAKTPRPRRRTSTVSPAHSHSRSLQSIPPSFTRKHSPGLNSYSSLSLRSASSGGGALKRDLNALGGGKALDDDESLLSDYGSILEGDSPFEDLESLEMEMELDGGSESDSSIDVQTPLPHLMFRDGLLSPRSKLLPQSLKQPSHPDLGSEDRSKSVLSIASTAGSVKTKSGLQKDPRHTERRRIRHRDGELLRAGMGLTTGLGWSDSEDEDAPSALTRKLITTTIERKRSTTVGHHGNSPPLSGFGGFSRPSSGYENQEKGLSRHATSLSTSAAGRIPPGARKPPSIGGLRSASISFPAGASRKEVPVPIRREVKHMRNDSSNSDSPRSNETLTPTASSSSPASSVVAPLSASQSDLGKSLSRNRGDSVTSDASVSTSRITRSRSSSYSTSLYSTSTVNRLESPPTSTGVLSPTRISDKTIDHTSNGNSDPFTRTIDTPVPAVESTPMTRPRNGSIASTTSQSTNHSTGRPRKGSASSNSPPSAHRLPRSLSKAQSMETIESIAESHISVASGGSTGSSYSHLSGQGVPAPPSSSSSSSHSAVPRPLKLPQAIGMGTSFVRSFSQDTNNSNSVYSSTQSNGSNGDSGIPQRSFQFSNSRSFSSIPASPPLQSSISSPPLSARTMSPPPSGEASAPTSPGSTSPRPRPQASPIGARPRPRTGTGMAYRTSSGVEYRTSAYGFGATSFVGDPSARMRSLSIAAAAVREAAPGLTKSTSGSSSVGGGSPLNGISARSPTAVRASRPSPTGMVDGRF